MIKKNYKFIIKTMAKRICDWGIKVPTKSEETQFGGTTAPLWRNPSQCIFLIIGIINTLIFFIELMVVGISLGFNTSCSSGLEYVRNLTIFFFFLNGMYQLWISAHKWTSDTQWFRFIAISTVLNAFLLFLVFMMISELSANKDCRSKDVSTYNSSVSIIVLGAITGIFYVFFTAYLIMKLYLGRQLLVYNEGGLNIDY
ncbi:unnamed protein product [Blepharisma stoltei]|uniref:MARVEL domain-containing protein n=1 Tax=Blepharisma stoltei TaxID=1481888 RepID=A0AAU9JJ68_9CILI|nr:unnamed protein product [Blepharisma stoltei]